MLMMVVTTGGQTSFRDVGDDGDVGDCDNDDGGVDGDDVGDDVGDHWSADNLRVLWLGYLYL